MRQRACALVITAIMWIFATNDASAQKLWMVIQVEGVASSIGSDGAEELGIGATLRSGDKISVKDHGTLDFASYEDCGLWRLAGPARLRLPDTGLKADGPLTSQGHIEGCGPTQGAVGADTYAVGALVLRGSSAGKKLAGKHGLPGAYRALIIGINKYKDSNVPQLRTAVEDAKGMRDVLVTKYGFSDVTLLLDDMANRSAIIRELRRISAKGKEDDSVLIYYAGHGERDRITGSGWWIPQDAVAQDPSTYIDNSVIQSYIKAIPARHVLLISDSCFSGTLFGSSRSLPPVIDDKYYATLYSEKSRWGFTSGNLTPVADSGSGGHSIFANQLIRRLSLNEKPYVTPRELYAAVGPVVRNNSEQMPMCNPIKAVGDEGGEFVFIRTGIPGIEQKTLVEDMAAVAPARKTSEYRPMKSTESGQLSVSTKPAGAKIYLDDTLAGDTYGGSLVWDNLPVGEYQVKAAKDGYGEKSVSTSVKKGSQSIVITLSKIPDSTPEPKPQTTSAVASVGPAQQEKLVDMSSLAGQLRVLVLVDEKIEAHRTSYTENALQEKLMASGFQLLDPGMIAELLAKEDSLVQKALDGDIMAAVKVGAANGADVVITGRAMPSLGDPLHKLNTGQADLSLRAVHCSTAKIIASTNSHGAFTHISAKTAQSLAIQKAAKVALESGDPTAFMSQMKAFLTKRKNQGLAIRLVVDNVTEFNVAGKIKRIVAKADTNVIKVVSHGWKNPKVELEVFYKSTPEELAGSIDGKKIADGKVMRVTDYTESGVQARIE